MENLVIYTISYYNLHIEYEQYVNMNNLRFYNLYKPLIDIDLETIDYSTI